MVADVELNLAGTAVVLVAGQGYAVVDADRTDGQIETNAKTVVGIVVVAIEVPRVLVDVTGIDEEGAADAGDDREGHFQRAVPEGVASVIDAVIIGPHLAELEAAQVVRAAEKESVEDRHITAAADRINRRQLAKKIKSHGREKCWEPSTEIP